MNDPSGFDDDPEPNPFGDMTEGLNQIFQMFGAGGPGGLGGLGGLGGAPNWEHARQAAGAMASEGEPEANIDPLVRMQFEQLARVAELQIAEATGMTLSRSGAGITISPVNRHQWAAATVDAYRPLFEKLAGSLGRMMTAQLDELSGEDIDEVNSMMPPGLGVDMGALMANMSGFIGPIMLITMAGSTVGQLGTRAFGSYDLPIPRPPSDELLVVANAIDEFGEAWSLPLDDLRLYTCLHEMAHHAVLSLPHVRERLTELLTWHADGFEADPAALEERLGPVDMSDPQAMERLQSSLASPEFMLNAIRSERQSQILPLIDTLVGCIEGYVDWVVDTVGTRLLRDYPRVSEALRRRRVEASEASRFVERLFGLELTQSKIDRGAEFVDGVFARGGKEALAALWSDVDHLPTPNELAAPGLWLARIGLTDDDQPLPELDEEPDIPDFPDLDT
ncbi:MAG: zinc-dependent metalloprotease [Acidimicrobiales bacterium]